MKPKTMILMVVAVGCGLGASYMTSKLLADRNQKQAEIQTIPVLVAKTRVPGWQPIKEPEKLFEIKMFPVDVAPKRPIGNFEDLKDQRLNKPLDETKPVTQDDLLTKEQENIADKLLPGQRAVSIKVTAEASTAGFVLPGSRVDVICTRRGNEPITNVVLQNMLVLAVDAQDSRNPEQKNIQAQTVTLAATPHEAARLALASSVGELRLAIKNQGDTSKVNNVVVKASDLLKPLTSDDMEPTESIASVPVAPNPGTSTALPVLPEEEKPAPKEEAPVVVKPAKPTIHVMTIYNGSQKEKAVFRRNARGEEEEDVTSSNPAGSEEATTEEKPAPKKPTPKSNPGPTGSVGSGKSTQMKRIQ